jgi:hypothetical protein
MYNSVGFLGFSVLHNIEDVSTIPSHKIREAIITKLASLDDEQLKSQVELTDTYDEVTPL